MPLKSWTYNAAFVGSSDLSTLRFLLQDTSSGDQQLDDHEVRYLAAQSGNLWAAASAGCLTLATQYARQVNKRVDSLWLDRSDRAKMYRELARDYRRKASLNTPIVYAGGISVSDKDSIESDTDRVTPAFTRGMMSYPGTTASTS